MPIDYSQLAIDIENDVGWGDKTDQQIVSEMNALTKEVDEKAQWTELGLFSKLNINTALTLIASIKAAATSGQEIAPLFDAVLRSIQNHADGNGIDLSDPVVPTQLTILTDFGLTPEMQAEVLALGKKTIQKHNLKWQDVARARKRRV